MIMIKSPEEKEIFVNEFAIRSFRDVGDFDYIAARIAYKTKLYPQFLWSGQQTIEKYLKCILLLNRIKAKDVKHNLSTALNHIDQQLPFKILLSDRSRKTIEYFDTYGRFRYFETPYHVYGDYLINLDRVVWELRRYCRGINYESKLPDGTKKSNLQHELLIIEKSEKQSPQLFKRVNGELEKILKDKKHPAREFLVWKNLFFGTQPRKRIKIQNFIHSANSPLALSPTILDDIQEYVYLPKDVAEAYRHFLKARI